MGDCDQVTRMSGIKNGASPC